jgi:cysteine synthase
MPVDYFRDLETPRLASLAPNLIAAAFPLMKLMPARFVLDQAQAAGALKPGGHIVETTSGTFGMALALLAAARGYRLTLVTTTGLTDAKFKARLERIGAHVLALEDEAGNGDQAGRLSKLHEILSSEPDCFWTRQYEGSGNWLAYSRLADLFAQVASQIDFLVGCVGTGGSLCGTGAFLRQAFPDLQIIAVDTHRSILFGQPLGRRMLRGLGNSILPANVRHDLIDEIHWVGAYPAYVQAHRLLRKHGIFQGPTSGAAALVAEWIASMHPEATVAVILPDEGHRYVDTIYDDAWLAALPDWPCAQPGGPTTLEKIVTADEASWTRFSWGRQARDDVMRAQALLA